MKTDFKNSDRLALYYKRLMLSTKNKRNYHSYNAVKLIKVTGKAGFDSEEQLAKAYDVVGRIVGLGLVTAPDGFYLIGRKIMLDMVTGLFNATDKPLNVMHMMQDLHTVAKHSGDALTNAVCLAYWCPYNVMQHIASNTFEGLRVLRGESGWRPEIEIQLRHTAANQLGGCFTDVYGNPQPAFALARPENYVSSFLPHRHLFLEM